MVTVLWHYGLSETPRQADILLIGHGGGGWKVAQQETACQLGHVEALSIVYLPLCITWLLLGLRSRLKCFRFMCIVPLTSQRRTPSPLLLGSGKHSRVTCACSCFFSIGNVAHCTCLQHTVHVCVFSRYRFPIPALRACTACWSSCTAACWRLVRVWSPWNSLFWPTVFVCLASSPSLVQSLSLCGLTSVVQTETRDCRKLLVLLFQKADYWDVDIAPCVIASFLKACADPVLSALCDSLEQHAVDELLQLAVKGGDIDGQVLAYLELAQVCLLRGVSSSLDSLFAPAAEGWNCVLRSFAVPQCQAAVSLVSPSHLHQL